MKRWIVLILSAAVLLSFSAAAYAHKAGEDLNFPDEMPFEPDNGRLITGDGGEYAYLRKMYEELLALRAEHKNVYEEIAAQRKENRELLAKLTEFRNVTKQEFGKFREEAEVYRNSFRTMADESRALRTEIRSAIQIRDTQRVRELKDQLLNLQWDFEQEKAKAEEFRSTVNAEREKVKAYAAQAAAIREKIKPIAEKIKELQGVIAELRQAKTGEWQALRENLTSGDIKAAEKNMESILSLKASIIDMTEEILSYTREIGGYLKSLIVQ